MRISGIVATTESVKRGEVYSRLSAEALENIESLGGVPVIHGHNPLLLPIGKTDSLVKTRFEEVPAISHICALPYVGVVYGTETVYCTPARVRLF